MLSFVQNFFAPKANPIGVDFGSDSLRLAQIDRSGGPGEMRIVAAASADVPPHVRHDPAGRLNFFVETVKELLVEGKFRGRQCILGLPAAAMFIQHLRMPKMDEEAMKKALPWELRGKLPIDPSHAQLRHVIAGEIYDGQESRNEVIVIAAAKEMVHSFLAAAAKAKLDVIGMNVEPKAIVDCFSQIYRRKTDEGVVNCFVDIGCAASRAVVARGNEIYFARTIPVGGDHFSRATANALKIKLEDAKLLRAQIAAAQAISTSATAAPEAEAPAASTEPSADNSFALLPAGIDRDRRSPEPIPAPLPAESDLDRKAKQVTAACRESLSRLIEELELCRRYYETTFPDKPIARLIFIGGEARQKTLCQQIARTMGLAAQIGDPLARIKRDGAADDIECLDRKLQHPNWSVAIGLSMGPDKSSESAAVAAAAESTSTSSRQS